MTNYVGHAPPSGASSSPPPSSSPPAEPASTVKVTKMPKKTFHSRSARSHVRGDLASTMRSSTKMAGTTYRPYCATSHYQSIIADPARSTSIPVIFDEPHSGSSWSISNAKNSTRKSPPRPRNSGLPTKKKTANHLPPSVSPTPQPFTITFLTSILHKRSSTVAKLGRTIPNITQILIVDIR